MIQRSTSRLIYDYCIEREYGSTVILSCALDRPTGTLVVRESQPDKNERPHSTEIQKDLHWHSLAVLHHDAVSSQDTHDEEKMAGTFLSILALACLANGIYSPMPFVF